MSKGATSDNIIKPILVDSSGRPYVILTDGTNVPIFEEDDGVIAKEQTTIVVINLNYIWDAGNTQWVPMTQP